MIGGGTQNGLADDPYAACHHLLYDYLSRRSNGRPHAATFCTSNNLAVPTAGFVELGGFDETFPFAAGEDRDFCDRWRASGRAIVHAPDVVVHHAHPMTLRSFWRQHFRYGRGARRLHERRFARGAGGIALQRPSFYLGLLAFPFREVAPSSLPACMSLLLVSQVATAGGYVVERFVGSRPAHAAR